MASGVASKTHQSFKAGTENGSFQIGCFGCSTATFSEVCQDWNPQRPIPGSELTPLQWAVPHQSSCCHPRLSKLSSPPATFVSLVGGFNHLEKYEFVSGKDDIPYMKWKIKAMFEITNQLKKDRKVYWNPTSVVGNSLCTREQSKAWNVRKVIDHEFSGILVFENTVTWVCLKLGIPPQVWRKKW